MSTLWKPRQADHYEWFSGYLDARGLTGTVRVMMGLIAISLAISLLALLFSPDSPQGPIPTAMMWAAVAGGVAGTALWIWRWPTRQQSFAFAVVSTTSIALACLSYPNPLAALLGCIAFATSGAYIAFFHSTRLVLYNVGVAAGVGLVQAVRLAVDGHLALAGVDLFLVLQINIAMPLSIQVLVRALSADLVEADLDPLTGLLNRRAFEHQTKSMLRAGPGRYLLMALIDLDDFKKINDSRGHLAGDQALRDVAYALRGAVVATAIIARSGGEEFLIAEAVTSDDASVRAQRICDAVAGLPIGVTASVGTACTSLDGSDCVDAPLIDQMIAAADDAMYRAKRSGGNGFHHHGLVSPKSG